MKWSISLYDYNDAYIVERSNITIIRINLATKVAFKTFTSFINSITKVYGITIDDVKDLDLILTTSNSLEYKSNCSYTTENACLHSKKRTNSNVNIFNNETLNPMEQVEP